jgi:dihydrolipoamide dehydrogenase
MSLVEVFVPELGDFSDVDVIEVLVSPGDRVEAEDTLISLETEKASMEVPAPMGGVVKEVKVAEGATVNEGDLIVILEAEGAAAQTKPAPETVAPPVTAAAPAPAPAAGDYDYEVLVLGSGPGGYTAAFRSADLGMKTALVEKHSTLGGVCLNVGCIPSKALLHAAKIIDEVHYFSDKGLTFGEMKLDLDKLRGWKDSIVSKLTGGLAGMAKARKVSVLQGTGRFTSPHHMEIDGANGKSTVSFGKAIIAAGSRSARIPGIPYDDPRVLDSTGALLLQDVPKRMLVIGGGIIGLEMACVYEALGSKITVVELLDSLIPGCDKDLVRPLEKRIRKSYENIYLKSMVKGVTAEEGGLRVRFEGGSAPEEDVFDRVLVAVGRQPNGALIGADAAGVNVDARGFISVDKQQRTNVPHIYAIGDIVGNPMLAHKATHEARVAAEAAHGMPSFFDAMVIPSVAYTDPEIGWVGLTEEEAEKQGISYGKGSFPWAASGRALSMGGENGMTKMLFDEKTHRVLGAGAVGPNAGELIAEAGLAIEMGCDAHDLGYTIHAHPTLSESMAMAAEVFNGTITDLYIPKKKKKK